ncbi:MAG TPA: hypothetical protein VFF81_10170 [Noviherbaspirillum sp.]|nr:hypothetical protein [Noviherbaspirillum sp.]
MRVQAKQTSTAIQRRGITALRKNRISLGRFQLPNRERVLHANQQAHSDATATVNDISYKVSSNDALTSPKIDTNAAIAQQSEQQAQAKPETAPSLLSTASALTRPVFDKDKVLPMFRKELDQIFVLGVELDKEEREYSGKVQGNAINGLAKILGVRRTYFDSATPEANKALFDELYQRCRTNGLKGKTSRTTEFHFLSRLLRQSDRKQASADAKVLLRAHTAGQTEQTFPEWVKNLGGLNKILKEIDDHERDEKKQNRKVDPGKCAKHVIDAVVNAQKAGSWSIGAKSPIQELPKALKALISPDGTWRPVVIKQHDDDLCVYILTDSEQDAPDAKTNGSADKNEATTS